MEYSKYYSIVRDEVKKLIKEYCKEGAHDIYHLDRVYKMALYINEKDNLNGDLDILCLASYMHDLHRLQLKDDIELKHSDDIDEIFNEVCNRLNLRDELIEKLKECIVLTDKHSFCGDVIEESESQIEGIILRDADNLDSLGAVGIARAFMFGQYIGEEMYDPNEKLEDREYDLTSRSSSIIHHFYEKLFKLEYDMITNVGKEIAKERVDYMEEYLNRFFEEFDVIV
ncbi:HD domain-containing protein [Clostridium sp. Ade.TY]|uniref:HD domain-containing protein n=1 Tax=Clostridium sp. Ade.TY TaxID=1391647 RepID=UPI000421C97C|nr:HD domain-containing protein [Clostridium sp. Ade.TY]